MLLLVPLVFLLASPLHPATADTLVEALTLTYDTNPELRAARAGLRSTDESYSQEIADWRPSVSASTSIGRDRTRYVYSSGVLQEGNRSPTNLTLSVSQNLYTAGRVSAGKQQVMAQIRAERADLVATEQRVLANAVQAYVDVVRDGAVLNLQINNEQRVRRQLEAARDRFQVGEVTRTDVAQAQSRMALGTADRVAAEGALASSRAAYRRVVGQAPGKLERPPMVQGLPDSRESAIEIAVAQNPEVIAAERRLEAGQHNVEGLDSELWPSAEVNASGTLGRESSLSIQRSRTAEIAATLTIPLYQSGAVMSQIRQAKQLVAQLSAALETTRQSVRESTARGWDTLVAAKARIKSLQEQVRAAEIALEGVQQEAVVGSRTVLDVLDAEQELLDARVSLVQAEREEVIREFQLLAAIGLLTAQDLGLPVTLYDPTRHFEDVHDQWWGSDIGEE